MRPLVCEVSLGEMLAFSLSRSWGTQKLRRLAELERHVVVVHILDPGEHRGEQGVARGVPPDIIESRNSFRTRQASAHDDRKRQVQVVAPVTSCRHRAALCAAHLVVPPP